MVINQCEKLLCFNHFYLVNDSLNPSVKEARLLRLVDAEKLFVVDLVTSEL